jgi:predicted nucleic acid-binding protein
VDALDVVESRVRAVPAHVLLESYSVLTRLPAPHRIDERTAAESLAGLALDVLALPAKQHLAIIRDLSAAGIRGGAVYDGLVAATVRHHGGRLLTLDRRARATYDVVGVPYEVL